jgi:hypothetical protein
LKEWTTPNFGNTPSTTNLEEEEIVDASGNDGNASMPEEIKRPNARREMMMMMTVNFHANPCSGSYIQYTVYSIQYM